jgi:hypothetical protein
LEVLLQVFANYLLTAIVVTDVLAAAVTEKIAIVVTDVVETVLTYFLLLW